MIAQNPAPGLGDGEWGDGLRQVLKKCLVKDVRKRSSASALLKMPFIKGAKPAKETLSTLISEAITLMDARLKKHGSLAPLEEEDEGGDTSAAGTVDGGDATMVVGATMVEASTMVGLDTMVVANDDAESSAAAPDGEQPAFMKRFIEMQAVLAAEAPPDSEGKSARCVHVLLSIPFTFFVCNALFVCVDLSACIPPYSILFGAAVRTATLRQRCSHER
jgi:hypothetical protein